MIFNLPEKHSIQKCEDDFHIETDTETSVLWLCPTTIHGPEGMNPQTFYLVGGCSCSSLYDQYSHTIRKNPSYSNLLFQVFSLRVQPVIRTDDEHKSSFYLLPSETRSKQTELNDCSVLFGFYSAAVTLACVQVSALKILSLLMT